MGNKVKSDIKSKILHEYYGEQQPGTAFIIRNTELLEKYKHVAFLSLCRVSYGPIPYDYAYTAMRAIILEVLAYNNIAKMNGKDLIEVIAIPTFSFGDSSYEEKKYA